MKNIPADAKYYFKPARASVPIPLALWARPPAMCVFETIRNIYPIQNLEYVGTTNVISWLMIMSWIIWFIHKSTWIYIFRTDIILLVTTNSWMCRISLYVPTTKPFWRNSVWNKRSTKYRCMFVKFSLIPWLLHRIINITDEACYNNVSQIHFVKWTLN